MTSIRLVPVLLLLAVAAACGGDEGLTVRGDAALTLAPDLTYRFTFPEATALQPDGLAASREGVFGGRCLLTPGALAAIDVKVERPGATDGLTAYHVQAGSDGGGDIAATAGGIVFEGSSTSAGCTVSTLYLDMDAGLAGVEVDCELSDADGNSAPSSADLHFSGCTVIDG